MNSGEFGTRHQEFGALHRTNWISLNLAQVGIELWWGGPYLTFLLWSAQSHFFPSSASNSSFWNQHFLDFYLSCLLPLDSSEFHSFSSWENQIDFLSASFPLSRPVAQTLDVFPRAAEKLMFYQTPVLQMMLGALFCSTAADNAPSSLLGFSIFAQIETATPAPPAWICHLGHSSRSW